MSPGPRTLAVTFPTLSSTPGVANRRRRSVVFPGTTPALPGPAMTEHRDYGRRHGALRPKPRAATGGGNPWYFREHNTGPLGPSDDRASRLRSEAWCDSSDAGSGDRRRRSVVFPGTQHRPSRAQRPRRAATTVIRCGSAFAARCVPPPSHRPARARRPARGGSAGL
jgi:hypothetical protein